MKEKLISKNDVKNLHPILRGKFGNSILRFLFSFTGINKVNKVYDDSKEYTGIKFCQDLLIKQGINVQVENYEILDEFKTGSFITVSNHPYGHIDGIMAIATVGAKRKDYKMMVNWMLSQIDTMDENFIGVNPYAKGSKMAEKKSSVGGVKQCIEHLREGHPLGLFPAGGVSDPHLSGDTDREWQVPVLRLIKKIQVPVIPMYISGNNSWFYRFLGFIDWRLRTVRLLHEVTNKRGKTVFIRFGKPILPEEFNQLETIEALGEFLKQKTYDLRKEKESN